MSNAVHVAAFACVLGGVLAALQAPTNAMLNVPLGSPVNAALVSFLVGTAALAALALALGARPDAGATGGLPWYAWIGGAYGAAYVVATAFAAPRLGIAQVMVLIIAGQLVMSLVLDHFGAFGLEPRRIDWGRALGVALVFAGVLLVRR